MNSQPDLLFGRLAVKAGLLTEDQVQDLVRQQAEAARGGVPTTLGELCQARRLLTSSQVQRVLLAQEYHEVREEDRLLGQLAVKNGFASEDEVALALDEQKQMYQEERRLPKRLGEILEEMGILSVQQVDALLSAQARLAGQTSAQTTAAPADPAPVEVPAELLPPTTTSGEEVTGWLLHEAGEAQGTTYALGKKTILGRQPTNEVPLPETQASRQHARIEFVALAKQHVITDLNSRNGTSVNGEPLTGPRALQPGDRIQIGDTVLRYEAGAGVTPGFIPPGVTMPAPGAGMESQRRQETVVRPSLETSQGDRPLAQSPSPGIGAPRIAPARMVDTVPDEIPAEAVLVDVPGEVPNVEASDEPPNGQPHARVRRKLYRSEFTGKSGEDPKSSPPPVPTRESKIAAGCVLLFVGLFVLGWLCKISGCEQDRRSTAMLMAEDFVRARLKYPEEASFPGVLEGPTYEECVKDFGGGRYGVRNWVMGKNALGVRKKIFYTCILQFKDDKWSALDVQLDE